MRLTLDHVIIRAGDVHAALEELVARTGLPVLAPPTPVAGMTSAVLSAGGVDVELLQVGGEPPPQPVGYGLGFTADRPLEDAMAALRALGIPTSAPARAEVKHGGDLRRWRAVQVGGLLADPFPMPMSTRAPGRRDRVMERVGAATIRLPGVGAMATRRAGGSMVVVTEYGFDAAAARRAAGDGPRVTSVTVGVAGHEDAWRRLPLDASSPLRLDESATGVTRVALTRVAGVPAGQLRLGDVVFEVV